MAMNFRVNHLQIFVCGLTDSDVVKSRVGSGDLLASIAKLLDRMPEDFQPKLKLYKAFQQFWCVVSRLHCDDESKSSSCSLVRLDAIARIARKSPLLVSSEEAQNLKQIVDVDFKFLTVRNQSYHLHNS